MKSFKIEKEYGIDYLVIHVGEDIMNLKKIIKENYDFLKNPNFKFIFTDPQGKDWYVLYMKKYKVHNPHGPAGVLLGEKIWSLDGNKFSSEEEYINEIRRKILGEILNEKNNKF